MAVYSPDVRLTLSSYIPKIFREVSTKRVMVAEWIDGVPVADKDVLTGRYIGDKMVGVEIGTRRNDLYRTDQRRSSNVYGLGVSPKEIMKIMVDLFCAQIFLAGWVHCDPHPGNILIRRLPNGKPELVLLDHGLYVETTPKFRREYALFWRSLLTFDNDTIHMIAKEWGIGNSDLFASAVLLKPYRGGSNETLDILEGRSGTTAYERHQKMRELMQQFLAEEEKMPQELVFIGRNMRIVQGNNMMLGSPVNRLRMVGDWASYSLTKMDGLRPESWVRHLIFRFVMLGLDVGFWISRVKQWIWGGIGFEESLENQMKKVAKEEFGVELSGDVFAG